MNIFKRLFKRKKNVKEEDPKCWYNNHHEKKRKRWVSPGDDDWYNSAQFEMATTNKIGKRGR